MKKTSILIVALFLSPSINAALCPDGTYVSGGQCKLNPDGNYTGGRKSTLCPDGTYVSGSRCKLNPDGTYSGSN